MVDRKRELIDEVCAGFITRCYDQDAFKEAALFLASGSESAREILKVFRDGGALELSAIRGLEEAERRAALMLMSFVTEIGLYPTYLIEGIEGFEVPQEEYAYAM
jgi:hypothetical protein|tara:strand:- start:120 stop:434 length:315 start_codon:yes stop_codon:yes gene_type:complete